MMDIKLWGLPIISAWHISFTSSHRPHNHPEHGIGAGTSPHLSTVIGPGYGAVIEAGPIRVFLWYSSNQT
jgi:hypothetical protein